VEFKLNEYHRNITDEELISDVIRVAENLGKSSITRDEYNKLGKYSRTTLSRRFGSWKKVLEKSKLNTEKHSFHRSDEEYIEDLKRVADLLKHNTVTTSEYTKFGKYDRNKLSERFGGWDNALKCAGLQPTGLKKTVRDIDLLEEIENVWISLGRQPTTTDIKAGLSKYSLNTYSRHFGSWRKALLAFISYINAESTIDEKTELYNNTTTVQENEPIIKHHTKRDINNRLRFLVLKRDNFKCCACGASPAKDPNVQLEVDHIFPWAKGGETIPENLQTLCKKCNSGKSDLV
jgi:hypothetical protein